MHSAPRPRFHLAVEVDDLAAARWFYGRVLGCAEGRSSERWVDFDLYGHQLVAHLGSSSHGSSGARDRTSNPVDGDEVPIPHFGVLLDPGRWRALADRLVAAGTDFVVEPRTRFVGQPGEQSTMFLRDPAGNALEFKAFADDGQVFAV
ncbi:VOC family protein [Ilumatobacter sp.]|uniref:VOC family protein n=1 Tax=Ilumatobacter sp. TaxID=1967498 RepID=UPI003B5293FA